MSDIQRWDMFAEVGINEPVKYDMWEAVEGRYVLYADHVAAVAAAERRVAQAHRDLCLGANGAMGQHEWLEAKGYAEGYDAATVKERQRSVLLIADAYGKALSAARDAVAAECIAHHGYTPGQTCPYCTDALAAIDGVEKP